MQSGNLSDTYQILGKIGAGSSGEVYKAYHKNLGKYVVLKKIKADMRYVMNKRTEVDILKNLRHSCLPQVLDFLEMNGNVYTVLDFIPGSSFQEYLDSGMRFKESSVLTWMKQLCETLCYLHSQHPPIIHGDIKPGNVMLMPDGNVCLIDFNIAASLEGSSAFVSGYTAGYAPPEQIQAVSCNHSQTDKNLWKRIDGRSDIYSLGAMMYHLLCGKVPKMNPSGYVSHIRSINPEVDEVFSAIIMKCLEANPDRRYRNAGDLLCDLKNMHKKNRRYKQLLIRQKITYGLLILGMVVSTGMAIYGYSRMDSQQAVKYYEEAQKLEVQGDYEKALEYYKLALADDGNWPEINFAEGEVYFGKGQYQQAKDIFLKCSEQTDNRQVQMNAYVMAAKSIDRAEGSMEEKIALLEKGRQQLPEDYNIGILEMLAQAYCDMGNTTWDKSYYAKAVSVFEQMKKQGMESYETDENMAVLYQNLGDFSMSEEILNDMLKKYGEDYRTYKKMAFLEVAKQSAVSEQQRDYGQFQKYSKKAEELYEKRSEDIKDDGEMKQLEELYSQAITSGWING